MFSSFFNPGYDLHVKAEEASFQLLFLDISGVSNLDLKIVGRDTVYVDGKIEATEANVNYEFTTEDIGTIIQNDDKNIFVGFNPHSIREKKDQFDKLETSIN